MEGTGLERDRKALRGGKALKGEAQERYRHETRPGGCGRSKPSRGCESLKTEGVGCGKPEVTGLPLLQALKGKEPQESCCRFADGGQVRSNSEEEGKLTGGLDSLH